jgi:hypothetical protein
MGARWYSPDVDTFLSRDTISEQLKTPISLNRYTYAADDPIQYFDPDGHNPFGLQAAWNATPKAQQQVLTWLLGVQAWNKWRSKPRWVAVWGTNMQIKVKPSSVPLIMVNGQAQVLVTKPMQVKARFNGSGKPQKVTLVPKLKRGEGGVLRLSGPKVLKGYAGAQGMFELGRALQSSLNTLDKCHGRMTAFAALACGRTAKYVQKTFDKEFGGCGPIGLGCVDPGDVAGFIVGGACEFLTATETGGASTPACGYLGRAVDGAVSDLNDDGGGGRAFSLRNLGSLKTATVDSRGLNELLLPEALTTGKNAATGVDVYLGQRGNIPVYAGISNNFANRAAQHGDRFDGLALVTGTSVTRGEARAVEEALIVQNPGFENQRHSISPRKPFYDDALAWGQQWLSTHGY